MPHLTVQIHEDELDGKVEPRLVRALTDAVAAVYGDWARAVAVVDLFGIPRGRSGIGGRPTDINAPIVTLTTREGALHRPEIPDAAARLIASITDAVVTVFGETVRPHVTVLVIGIPSGRSGVGGELV
jgi:phenylpyruvate tautomerase PptA (4-oxalocrotonate tautomerase family)